MRKEYSVERLCKTLGVSKSGYYDYMKRPQQGPSERDLRDIKAIKRTYNKSKGTYGCKHIAGELKERGHIINHKRVARLMHELNLASKIRKARITRETRTNLVGHVYPNILNRNFDVDSPNLIWVMDLTEIKAEGAKLFISAIVDLFNRELIALAVGSRPIYELVEATINMAMNERDLQSMKGILFHTDQGSVFTSLQHHKKSKELGFTPRMSRKANCWDNAVIESIFSHFKTEFDFHYPLNNYAQAKIDLLAFRNYFNDERSQKRLGYKTPKAFLEAHLLPQS
ncbi:IS3 family transposase [Sporosarcina psychrophila]|uniref:IS3 family transposase n=1 Tax=Sporosarcina psychrophila TaxID=1476 RepID=UPI0030CCE592